MVLYCGRQKHQTHGYTILHSYYSAVRWSQQPTPKAYRYRHPPHRRTTGTMFKAHLWFSNEDLYNKTLSDPRVSLETVYTSLTGIRINTATVSLSTLASFLLIIIIYRSKTKMGSVYHRIMFGMSFFDIVQSLAMAFTTLPMPTCMIYDQFEGLIIGTEDSRKAHGFMFLIGSMTATTYNAMLCLYYLCALRYS